MDLLSNLGLAFSVVLQPENLLFCFIGVVIGTLVGVLPGLGPAATIAILLPATFHVSAAAAVIMLAGIYYGAMYGGSITSILVNIPGEAASVVTCLDGYQMARRGRAGPALGISAFGSFIAGTVATMLIMLAAPWLANVAIRFGPPEYFALMVLGLTIVSYLASGSMLKALMMASLGLFLGSIGTDTISGLERFTFGTYTLMDGLGLVPVVMGLFGIGEIMANVEEGLGRREVYRARISSLLPTLADWGASIGSILRGSFLGFFLGILPGGGAVIASFASYAVEKRVSRHPERFGSGAIEGVAGPEAANNSASQGAFVPLLALGLPSNPVTAMLLGALLIQGVQIGPLLMTRHPDVFWGLIGSMYVGNFLLLLLNVPLIGLWVKILKVPYPILFPFVLLFTLVGSYSINYNPVEIGIMVLFGVIGYLMKRLDYEPAPLVLGFVLSPMLEDALRQSLIMSHGSAGIFVTRPLSVVLLGLAVLVLGAQLVPLARTAVLRAEGPVERVESAEPRSVGRRRLEP